MKKVEIKLLPNGPFRLSIDTEEESIKNVLFGPNGKSITIKKNSILCRCGRSKQQPFCDGVHRMCGFNSENVLEEESSELIVEPEPENYDGCKISIVKHGPINIFGKVALHVDTWPKNVNPEKYSLCRCGASQNKPFCDNAHTLLTSKSFTF